MKLVNLKEIKVYYKVFQMSWKMKQKKSQLNKKHKILIYKNNFLKAQNTIQIWLIKWKYKKTRKSQIKLIKFINYSYNQKRQMKMWVNYRKMSLINKFKLISLKSKMINLNNNLKILDNFLKKNIMK